MRIDALGGIGLDGARVVYVGLGWVCGVGVLGMDGRQSAVRWGAGASRRFSVEHGLPREVEGCCPCALAPHCTLEKHTLSPPRLCANARSPELRGSHTEKGTRRMLCGPGTRIKRAQQRESRGIHSVETNADLPPSLETRRVSRITIACEAALHIS